MQRQANQIYHEAVTDHNTLWVKHTICQKTESLRGASLSKLCSMVNNNFIFNTKDATFSTKWWVLLHFHSTACAYNQRYNLHQKTVPLLQSIFTSYSTLICSQNPPYNLHQHPLLLYLSNFSPPFFFVQPFKNSTPKIFSLLFCQFRLRQGTRELGSLMRTQTVLISPFFLKVWTAIAGLTITDSSLLRLRKLVYCRCGKLSNPPSFIPSTYFHYFYTLLIPPQELAFSWKPIA